MLPKIEHAYSIKTANSEEVKQYDNLMNQESIANTDDFARTSSNTLSWGLGIVSLFALNFI